MMADIMTFARSWKLVKIDNYQRLKEQITDRQVRVCNVKYVLDRVNRRDGYSMKKFVSFARGPSFHTKHASNVNVVQV
jgi:hypothetical protein